MRLSLPAFGSVWSTVKSRPTTTPSYPLQDRSLNRDIFQPRFAGTFTKTEKNNLRHLIKNGFFDSSEQVQDFLNEDSEDESGQPYKRFEQYDLSRLPSRREIYTPLQDARRLNEEKTFKASGQWDQITLTPEEEKGLTTERQVRDKLKAKRRKAAGEYVKTIAK